jgi:hypothetical protein
MTLSARSEWFIPALLILLSLMPSVAGAARLAELASGGEIIPAKAASTVEAVATVCAPCSSLKK